MTEKRRFTREAFTGVEEKVRAAGGDTSYAGKQRKKAGLGLHPLVDPKGFGVIRRSLPRYTELPDGRFLLPNGVPMLEEVRFDTTGSMGRVNIELAFESLPKSYGLFTEGKKPVLGRYDPQIINGIFGDVQDEHFILCRSQAEMDEKIAEQLTHMDPECDGGDSTEDPDYGFFGAAYLTDAFIWRYGLKSYDFTMTDAPCRMRTDVANLIRVFGDTVFEKVRENGFDMNERQLPDTRETITELKKRSHAFLINFRGGCVSHWSGIYGAEHVIVIDDIQLFPYVKAAVIGLTEGVLDLQTVTEYLQSVGCDRETARSITRSVAGIPVGAQAMLPNFNKIPLRGSVFAKKHDLWPIDMTQEVPSSSDDEVHSDDDSVGDEDGGWL